MHQRLKIQPSCLGKCKENVQLCLGKKVPARADVSGLNHPWVDSKTPEFKVETPKGKKFHLRDFVCFIRFWQQGISGLAANRRLCDRTFASIVESDIFHSFAKITNIFIFSNYEKFYADT